MAARKVFTLALRAGIGALTNILISAHTRLVLRAGIGALTNIVISALHLH